MTADPKARVLRRAPLVAVAIGLVQAALLGVGWLLLYSQTHERVAQSVEGVIIQANLAAAQSIADSLGTLPSDLDEGSAEWERSQSVIEDLEFAGGGFACIVDEEGFIACHPDLRDDPSLRSVNLTDHALRSLDGEQEQAVGEVAAGQFESGIVDFGFDGKHYVTTLKDASGTQLMVHQPVSGLTAASRHITGGIAALGIGIGAAVFVLTGVLGFLVVRSHSAEVVRWNEGLEQRVQEQTREIVKAHEGITFGIAKLAEYRDNETGMHVERMCAYSAIIARQMRDMGEDLSDEWIDSIRVSASLHDIGKVSTPDAILLKPGRLTPDEFEIMKGHAATGQEALEAVRAHVGPNPLIEMGIEIAGGHHERWDGKGYPRGLEGEQIPLSARIVAVADVFDALMSKRVYKAAMPIDEVEEIIRDGSGGHFDPRVVEAFFAVEDELLEVRRTLHDEAEPAPSSPHKEHSGESAAAA